MSDDLVLCSKRGVITFQLHLFSIDKVNGDKCRRVWGGGCGLFKRRGYLEANQAGRLCLQGGGNFVKTFAYLKKRNV